MDTWRYLKKNIYPSNCNRSRFIYFFQFDFGCTSYATATFLRVQGEGKMYAIFLRVRGEGKM